jgi:hypothetical protein
MKASDMQITEMSLTGNQDIEEMRNKRIVWPTVEATLDSTNMNFVLGAVPGTITNVQLGKQVDLLADPARTDDTYGILLQQ